MFRIGRAAAQRTLLFLGLGIGTVLLWAGVVHAGILDVSWTAPTVNTDGSPLTDLASYHVYYSTSSSACSASTFVQVPSTTSRPSTNQTVSLTLRGLATGTRYYVSVAAVDSSGAHSPCLGPVSNVARADFSLTPTGTLNFGSVRIGSSVDQTLTVKNTGGGTVSGTVSTPSGAFRIVSGSPFSLVGLGASQVIVVRFTPTIVATATTSATVSAGGGSISIGLTGTGTSASSIDTTRPVVAIASPTTASTYSTTSTSVALRGTASDNAGVTQVTWRNSLGGSGSASGTTSWSVGTIPLQPGANVVTVTAVDAAGNAGTATLTVTRTTTGTGDTVAPTVTMTSPPAGAFVAGMATIAASASDNVKVVGVQFLIDGAPFGPEQTSGFSLAWNTTSVANGKHAVSARARDGAGNVAVAPAVTVTVSNSTTPASTLVAAYAFNEGAGSTVSDRSGNGNTGTISGATWTTAGKYGGGLLFGGSGRVTIADAPELHLTSGMTLEAWVKPSVVSSDWRDVVYKGDDNYYVEATSPSGGVPGVGGTFGGVDAGTAGITPLSLGTWTHLAATYDGAAIRFYVNGALVSSVSRTGTIATSSQPLQIGGDSIYGQFFQGTIDEVRVYNAARTQAQIQSDMVTPLP